MSEHGDDAQRDMERRALRNVRGLLDKMENQDRIDRRTVIRIAIAAVVLAVIFTAFVALWISARKAAPTTNPVVIPPVPKSTSK